MRELREFRECHADLLAAGTLVAGVSADSIENHRRTIERHRLPYPLLSDRDQEVAESMGLVRRFGIGPWSLRVMRRTTLLIDRDGVVAAIWGQVRIRGHAREVLAAARALHRADTARRSS